MDSRPGYEGLRHFRISQPATDYFLTMGTAGRQPGLSNVSVASAIRHEIEAIQSAGYWTVRGATIMPDHFHLLVTLHDKLPLGRPIARLKSKTRVALSANRLRWQGNYYEHRLRNTDAIEGVLLDIFLNPYRAALLATSEDYPWFWLGAQETAWFKPLLDDGKPFADWLR